MRDIGEGTVRRIDWQELTPVVRLLRIFNTALDVRILFLAGIGVLLTLMAAVVLNRVFDSTVDATIGAKPARPHEFVLENVDPSDPNSELWFRQEGENSSSVGRNSVHPVGALSAPAYVEPLVDFQHVHFQTDKPISFREEPTTYLWTLAQRSVFVPWDIFSTSGRRLCTIDSVSGTDRCFAAFWFLLLLFLWALLGGMICRTAALRLTVDRSESFGETWRFMKERGNGFVSSVVILSLGIGFCTLPILLGGYLFSLPGLNYVVGLAFPLVLLFAFFAILLALGLYVGWPLLFAAVSVDGSDGYDAVSRMFSYVFQRPLHYLVYWTLSAVLGVLGFIFISIFLDGMVYVAVTLGGFPATAALPSLGHLAIPETTAELAGPNMLVLVWCALAQLLKLAFAFSWFFTTGISVYLLLRRSVDATPFNEVLLLGPAAAEAQTLPAIKTDAKGAPEMCDVS